MSDGIYDKNNRIRLNPFSISGRIYLFYEEEIGKEEL